MVEITRLGLIGDNIVESRAPRLHEYAGKVMDIQVTYDRLVPQKMGLDFTGVFRHAQETGYRGLNITYPYKEMAVPLLTIPDAKVARLGAVNTIVFEKHGPLGYNTDWSGFIAAYRHIRKDAPAGRVCMVGAGGVGKAVAFGLLELGVTELRLVERDLPKAEALAAALTNAAPGISVSVTDSVAQAAPGADGLINCTPVGMVGYDGTPLPRPLLKGAGWVFDAVYTPVETTFLKDAAREGQTIISGEELFFYQGLHALSNFHGRQMDEAVLRRAITEQIV